MREQSQDENPCYLDYVPLPGSEPHGGMEGLLQSGPKALLETVQSGPEDSEDGAGPVGGTKQALEMKTLDAVVTLAAVVT